MQLSLSRLPPFRAPVKQRIEGKPRHGEHAADPFLCRAARAGKRALGLFTISDHIYRAEELTSEQRQNSFVQMITIALDTAVNMANL